MPRVATVALTPLSGIPAVSSSHASDAPQSDAAVLGLTRGLAAGHEAAFREFHALYFDRLHHFLLSVTLGDEHAARDALQETLLRVARYAREFEREEVFWGWLKAVARSAARDGGRKRRRYRALLDRFMFHRIAPLTETDDTTRDDNLHALVESGLAELDPDERRLIEGKYLHGATVLELAEEIGLTEKAVESRLGRIRRHLAAILLRHLRAR